MTEESCEENFKKSRDRAPHSGPRLRPEGSKQVSFDEDLLLPPKIGRDKSTTTRRSWGSSLDDDMGAKSKGSIRIIPT